MVTLTGAGTVVLNASQAANGNYAAGTATATFTVAPEVPTLTFGAIGSETYGGAAFGVSATSASSGAVTYSVVSGLATIAGNVVTITGAGTVVLSASQAANGNYAVATATTTFAVATEVPTLTFATIGSETYGGAAFAVSATSASSGAVTDSVVSGPATIAGNVVTLTGAGTVVLSANQAANGNYAAATATTTFTVSAEVPTLTFGAIGSETYGGAAFGVSATSASSGAVTYSLGSGPATITSNGTVTITGAGTVVLNASQAANGNYAVATATTTFTVAAEVPTLTFASIGSRTYGGAAFTVSATSASSGAETYSVLDGPATVAGNTVTMTGVGTVVLSASQAANGNYATATATTTFTVAAEVPTLTFATIGSQTAGVAFAVSATSASSGAVTYSVVSGSATIAGNMVTATAAGTVTLSASQAANGNYAAATANSTVTVANSTPLVTSLVGSSATPPYGGTVNLVPTFSGGTAVIGFTGAGSSGISASAVSGGSYTTPAVTAATTYTLTVTGTGGNTASTTFTATPSSVTISPVTPANQTIAPGQQSFSATVIGGATDRVTWSSASGGSMTSGGVWTSPDTPGTYTVTATSSDESGVSASTTVTVSKPVITVQPTSKNACTGYNPSLSTAANYATSYQWYFRGGSLSGGSLSTLTLTDATSANNGTYYCLAINAAGLATTNTVTLNVVSKTSLTITSQPAPVNVYATQTATFAVAASGTGALSYQWYTGSVGSGTAIGGATSGTYTTAALTTANSGTSYYVTVTDPDCTDTTVTSTAAELTVSSTDTAVPPTIVTQPTGQTATVGGAATFNVVASGAGTLIYQWYRVAYSSTELSTPTAGVAIGGATGASYTVPAGETAQSNDGDNYYVVVTNAYGSAVSNRVTLAVGAGIVLQITAEPQTGYVAANTLASFSTTAACTGCIPAYQWYWYAPGSTTVTALSNEAVSSGTLSGATVEGTTTSSLTLENVPTTASGAVFYVVVTSTSDGTIQISGTNPLTSSTAGLFVGSLGTIGNTTAGDGLCNSSSNWVLNGTNPGTSSGDVPYQNTSACTIEMTNDQGGEHAAVYWPTLISTAKFTVSFTVALSATGQPADGFTLVLADPSQGATTSTLGLAGSGLGAMGIPGFVLGFDTYQNGDLQGDPGCTYDADGTTVPCDPVAVPYMAVGHGATNLWENPWTFVNGNLNTQSSTDYAINTFANATHSYVVTVVNSVMTVTMDGYELFTGTVSLPPAAYLGFTASTGGSMESVTVSGLTATVSAP
jgi:hypothetical protein